MALLGTKDNPYKSSKDAPASVYFRGPRAVKKMQEILGRELTPTEKKIVEKEGYVDGYYLDSRNILTRGVGQTGDYAKGKESHSGFEKAIADSTKAANKQAKAMSEKGQVIDPNFTESLVGVNFQLGSEWTTKFPTAWSNLQEGKYEDAIEEIRFTKKGSGIASDWAKQTPTRVDDFTQAIRDQADYKPGKQSFLGFEPNNYFGEATRVASLNNDMVYGGSDNLYANQNLPNAPRNLERAELPPDQTIIPYRETIKEDVTVSPDQIRTTETIGVTAPRYSVDDQQERARRSMMQGNYDDRMEDYQYSSEYQEDYPYLYPRNTGSYALPQQQAAQRMMGGGMGYAEGGTVNQAQGIASLGRGGDSTLVHMQPQEVAGLQQMAQANGTSLTTNPMTGMPEAFSLGNMFKAALPIAAGYMTGGAANPFLGAGTATASAITAGAATGAGLAAMSGEDVLAGGLSGGLGGYSGMGLETALGGSAIPAAPAAPSAGNLASTGSFNPALDSTLTTAGGGAAPLTQGSVFDPSINPGASTLDTIKQNLGVNKPIEGTFKQDGDMIRQATKFVPGDNIDVAMKLGSPAVSMGMGGLEASDFYNEPDFSDPRDKYSPYSKLNLNKDTGISSALAADTGLRLFAKGGSINLNQRGQNLNQRGQNLNQQGQNVNSRGINVGGRGINTSALTSMQGLGSLNLNSNAMRLTPEQQDLIDNPQYKLTGTGIMGQQQYIPTNYKGIGSYNDPYGITQKAGEAEAKQIAELKLQKKGVDSLSLNSRGINLSGKRRFAVGGYLKGPGDGMSDDIPATINGEQPAALADGEFVVPADVVSHLGNGSSEAGSKQLYAMMDRIRKARTGRKSQGKEIKPGKYMPR